MLSSSISKIAHRSRCANVSTQILTRVEFDFEELHELSLVLLKSLEESGVTEGVASLALALSLGRLLSPERPMEEPAELAYIQAAITWSGAFFAEGEIN